MPSSDYMKKRQAQKNKSSTTTPPVVPITPSPIFIKQPLVVDVAYNNVSKSGATPIWSMLKDTVSGVITKASEGMFTEDNTFARNWYGLLQNGIPRGAYHFYRQFYPSAWNAKKFVNTINKYGGVLPKDILMLDAEEQNMSVSALLDFTYNVEQLTGLSHKTNIIWYSWPWMLNSFSFVKLKSSQVEYIREIGILVAGYPNNPNLYPDPYKAGYTVDTSKYGRIVGWQYADNVIIPNIPGGTDVDWIDAQFLAEWKGI